MNTGNVERSIVPLTALVTKWRDRFVDPLFTIELRWGPEGMLEAARSRCHWEMYLAQIEVNPALEASTWERVLLHELLHLELYELSEQFVQVCARLPQQQQAALEVGRFQQQQHRLIERQVHALLAATALLPTTPAVLVQAEAIVTYLKRQHERPA